MSEQHVESEYERGYAAGYWAGRASRAGELVELRRQVRTLRRSLVEAADGNPWLDDEFHDAPGYRGGTQEPER